MQAAHEDSSTASVSHKSAPDVVVNLTIIDILDYVGDAVRPIREGFAVFEANHIVVIGYRSNSNSTVEVVAYVTQSSHPGILPHEVKLKITENVNSWKLECSCKAGTAKCKHIIACLLHLEKNEKIEYLSCTDVKQAWGISKAQKSAPWTAKRIRDLCCVPKTKQISFSNDAVAGILADSFHRILSVCENSAISKHSAGRHLNEIRIFPDRALQSAGVNLVDDFCTEDELMVCLNANRFNVKIHDQCFASHEEEIYYQANIAVDLKQSVDLAITTKYQDSNQWKIQRSTRITASSCYQLFTYINNKNPNWDKKIKQYWDTNVLKIKATKYGKDTEPLAYESYKRKRNPLIKKCGLLIHPTENWIGGSPDGLDPLMNVLLEIKCPVGDDSSLEEIINSPSVLRYIKCCSNSGNLMLNDKHMYYCQVQINMWIANCPMCDFIIYSKRDDDFALIEVPFDSQFVGNVINELKKLYFHRMLRQLLNRT